MKKVAMLMGILALCTTGFAKGGDSDTANVGVYATVAKDLKVETSPVDFGLVMRRNNQEINKENGHAGKIIITGEKDSLVSFDFQKEVSLKKTGTESVLVYKPVVTNEKFAAGATVQNGSNIKLENGKVEYGVEGTLNVPEDAVSGRYNGTMWVKVKYVD